MERCPQCDKPLEPCGSCPQCGEYAAPAQGTPEPPKVEEALKEFVSTYARLNGMREQLATAKYDRYVEGASDFAEALRPYFPPGSQTPPLENVLNVIGGLIATFETGDHADNPCGDCVICTAEKILEELATPASTARTDALSKLLEVLGAIESVSGDDFCADLEMRNANRKLHGALATAYEKLGQIYRLSHGFNTQNSCHYVHTNWREELKKFAAPGSVPQAEPPKCSMCRGVKRIKKPDGCGSMTCPKCSRGAAQPGDAPQKEKP